MTFLVVGGAEGLAEGVQERLEERGFGCLISRDLEDADWTLQVARVEALVLDLDLDGTGTLDWLEGLGLARPEIASRTVALTGRDLTEQDLSRLIACGAEVIRKPTDLDRLSAAVLRKAGPDDETDVPGGGGPTPAPDDALPEA
jgi:DNA-binding response OmpR family regulator